MTQQVLFVQGGSEGAYDADLKLVANLRGKLGASYNIRYPKLPNEDEPDYHAWKQAILDEVSRIGPNAFLVGHSIGASVLIKLLTEEDLERSARAIFLISTPFWYDHDFWRWDEVKLPKDAAELVPTSLPINFYHGRADESVPFDHMEMYAKVLPKATFRALDGRDHQLNEDLSEVAEDILAIK